MSRQSWVEELLSQPIPDLRLGLKSQFLLIHLQLRPLQGALHLGWASEASPGRLPTSHYLANNAHPDGPREAVWTGTWDQILSWAQV